MIVEENHRETVKEKRFAKIRSYKANEKTFEYLKSHFNNLKIEVLGDYEGNIMELMQKGLLKGWCWETTETAILFLNDNSYIQRGNLKFDEKETCYHSWIVFSFDGEEYVFDPCLNLLCKKTIFDKVFEVEVKGQVSAKQVKDYFVDYITNPPKRELTKEEKEIAEISDRVFTDIFGKNVLDDKKNEIIGPYQTDVNAPMYRNSVGYKTTLENGKIKQLVAHYY